jgi:hypothetical protein
MASAGESVVLVSYLNAEADPVEWVLEDLPDGDVEAIRVFLEEEYPDSDVRVDSVCVESAADLLEYKVEYADEAGEPVPEAIRRLAKRG